MNRMAAAAEERMSQTRRDSGERAIPRARWAAVLLATFVLLTSCSIAWAAVPGPRQKHFETPDEAVQGLIEAVRKGDTKGMVEVLGPSSGPLVSSGDKVEANGALFIQFAENQ